MWGRGAGSPNPAVLGAGCQPHGGVLPLPSGGPWGQARSQREGGTAWGVPQVGFGGIKVGGTQPHAQGVLRPRPRHGARPRQVLV